MDRTDRWLWRLLLVSAAVVFVAVILYWLLVLSLTTGR